MENKNDFKVLLEFPVTVISHNTKEVADQTKPDVYTVAMESVEGELQIGKQDASFTGNLKGIDDTLLRDFPNGWQFKVKIEAMFRGEPERKIPSRPTAITDSTFTSGECSEESKLFDNKEAEHQGKILEEQQQTHEEVTEQVISDLGVPADVVKAAEEEPAVKTKAKDRKNRKLATEVKEKESLDEKFDLGKEPESETPFSS